MKYYSGKKQERESMGMGKKIRGKGCTFKEGRKTRR